MNLYKRISLLKNELELNEFKGEIRDRFGKIPEEVKNLFELIQIKWIAKKFCVEKLIIKKGPSFSFQTIQFSEDFGKMANY